VKTTAVSLDAPIQQGETAELQDVMADESVPIPDKTVGDAEMRCRMLVLVDGLEQRERTILTLRFGLNGEPPQSLDEVSQVIRRTRERIRQIQKAALAKLHVLLEEHPSKRGRQIA
jgi:RNA polymerase primary sigma factor